MNYPAAMNSILPIILASASPRRADLLRQAGIDFIAMPADVDERCLPNEEPDNHVIRLATEKARVVADKFEHGLVIGADTVVVVDGRILGKPVDRAEAVSMLRLLSGRGHRVMTGLALANAGSREVLCHVEITDVFFRELGDREIDAYVNSGEPMDKAGAYGIQEKGVFFVRRVEGCYNNVVGLPLFALGQMLGRGRGTV